MNQPLPIERNKEGENNTSAVGRQRGRVPGARGGKSTSCVPCVQNASERMGRPIREAVPTRKPPLLSSRAKSRDLLFPDKFEKQVPRPQGNQGLGMTTGGHGARTRRVALPGGRPVESATAAPPGGRPKPAVVSIPETAHWLASKGVENLAEMNKGGTQRVGDLEVTMVHADHSCGILDDGKIIYGGDPCGYVVRFANGFKLYHAGDTNVFGDMKIIGELYQPDLACLPIGDHYTMSPREAALAVRLPRRE